MSTPTPRTDEARRIDNGETGPLLDEMETLERELAETRQELATEREKVRLLVEMNEFVGAAQLTAEREKVRTLRDACDQICDEWGRNHDANPIGAGQRMSTRAGKALEATEDVA